jgi:arginine decarboxylase
VLLVPVHRGQPAQRRRRARSMPDEPHTTVESLAKILRPRPRPGAEPAELIEATTTSRRCRNEVNTLFSARLPGAGAAGAAERLYWSIARDLLRAPAQRRARPGAAEVLELEEKLTDQYLCNFSVFQSILDHWAIDQSFPILPIDRLDEQPTGAPSSSTSPATRTARSATTSRRCRQELPAGARHRR